MKNRGGLSTHFAEHIKRHRNVMGFDFDIYVEREATLSEDMTEIESRYLRSVTIVLKDGFADESRLVFEDRRDVAALRDALDRALEAVCEDQTHREARTS